MKGDIYFVFPGIGADYRKLMKKYGIQNELYKDYFIRAKDSIEINLEDYVEGKEVADKQFHSWCLTYTIDYTIYQELIEKGINPRYLLGYSMGLTTALACSNAITFEDGLKLLHIIRNLRQSKAEEAMLALIGWDRDLVEKMIDTNGYSNNVNIACENNQYCFILSGIRETLEEINRKVTEAGIYKTRWIEADRAFHSKFFQDDVEEFKRLVEQIPVRETDKLLLSTIDQRILKGTKEIRREVVRNLSCRMLWEKSIRHIINITKNEDGKRYFLEVSLGDMLTKTSKVIDLDSKFLNYKKFCDISLNTRKSG